MQALPPSQQLVERLILAQLQQDVHVLGVLEEVLKLYYMLVGDRQMDLNLTHQLLLGATFH